MSYCLKFFVVQGKAKPLPGVAALQEMELIFVNREFVQSIPCLAKNDFALLITVGDDVLCN